MSFQPDKLQLEREFDVLKQQASSTQESWSDAVQRKFYEQFIESLPKEFETFIKALDQLDKSFDRAEQHIDGLRG